MTADLLALLDQLDEAHAKGTADGEWRVVDGRDRYGWGTQLQIHDDEGLVAICSEDNDATKSTGLDRVDLVITAVNALPKLTAALRAVVNQHRPVSQNVFAATPLTDPADVCAIDNTTYYPCRTVRAITTALDNRPRGES